MSIFGSIVDRIFHRSKTSDPTRNDAVASSQGQQTAAASPQPQPTSSAQPQSAPTGTANLQNVDVEAVLTEAASKKGGGGNWRTSIVDLLKLLDLDSSLAARKDLASELNVHAGPDGSAEQNIALQKAVMAKLAQNGGKVPDSLRH
ncbi:MAG: DUF3597 domain-containing protein [Casimicrobiaceae bacterium]